jgi:hypothetical protein
MGEGYDVVWQKGYLVSGVIDVPERDLAIRAAIELGQQSEDD